MRTRYTFKAHVVRVPYTTHCVSCGKRLKRVLRDECYDNGLHDLGTTLAALRKKLEAQAKRHANHGDCCRPCSKWCDEQSKQRE